MPGNNPIGIHAAQTQTVQPTVSPREANVPVELRGARPSAGAIVGRVLAGIFTLGISEGIRAIVRHVRVGQPAGVHQEPAQQVVTPEAFNRTMSDKMYQGQLPPEYQAAVDSMIEELRGQFGTERVPVNATLDTLDGGRSIRSTARNRMCEATQNVTPEQMCAMLKEKFVYNTKYDCMVKAIKAKIQPQIREGENAFFRANVIIAAFEHCPEYADLAARIKNSTDQASLDTVLADMLTHVDKELQVARFVGEQQNVAVQDAVHKLAEQTGWTEETVRSLTDFDKLGLPSTAKDGLSKRPLGADDIKAVFTPKVDGFVQRKMTLFNSVKALDAPQYMKEAWERDVLAYKTLSEPYLLSKSFQAGSSVDARPLLEAMQDKTFSNDDICALVEGYGVKLSNAIYGTFSQAEWTELGGDGQGEARNFSSRAMLASVPGLLEAMQSRSGLMEALQNHSILTMQRVPEMGTAITLNNIVLAAEELLAANTQLGAALSNPETLSPLYANAINHVVADLRAELGENCLPASLKEIMSQSAPGLPSTLRSLMNGRLQKLATPVSTAECAAMFREYARQIAVFNVFKESLGEMAHNTGLIVSPTGISSVASIMYARHPEITTILGQADHGVTVRDFLNTLLEMPSLLRVQHDIESVWESGINAMYDRMSTVTGLDHDQIRSQLDLSQVNQSGRFAIMRADIYGLCRNPQTTVADMPSTEQIRQQYQTVVDTFVNTKTVLHTSVDGLGLSPELSAKWKSDVLTNRSLKQGNLLENCTSVARNMSDEVLMNAVNSGAGNSEMLLVLRSLAQQLDYLVGRTFPTEQLGRMEPDDLSVVNSYTLEAFIDTHPQLVVNIKAHAEQMQQIMDEGSQQMSELYHQSLKLGSDTAEGRECMVQYGSIASGMKILDTILQYNA